MAKTSKKKTASKLYLAVYTGTAAAMRKWDKLPRKLRLERQNQGLNGWMSWAMKNGRAIKDMGGPLGTTKRVDRRGIANIRNQMAAYTVVRAKTHAEAARIFRKHPHFMIFPGDAVEVMEILKIPGK